jgi:hypothetical protein
MANPITYSTKLSETLTLTEYKSGGHAGFWLFDSTCGMNLAMRAESERAAFIKALNYYQRRVDILYMEHTSLKVKVDSFISQIMEDKDDSE